MKVIDIGSGASTFVSRVYPNVMESEITRLDIDRKLKPDICHDITKPLPKKYQGRFDAAVCNHMLEHIDRNKVVLAMVNIADAVRYEGEVWVVVPSMEWAANEIIHGRDSLGVQGIVFGAQQTPHDYHRVGFTLNALEQVAISAGLKVEKKFQQEIYVYVDGHQFEAVQNVIKAVRR